MKRAQFSRLWVVCIFLLAVWPAYMLAIADQGPSPLHLAVVNGNLQNVVDLVNGGMDVNVRDKVGVTPLMIASMKGNLDIARFLVSKGASVDAREDSGFTALMCAATGKSAELAAFLLENRAIPDIRDSNGLNAFQWANFSGAAEVATLLRKVTKDLRIAKKVTIVGKLPEGAQCLEVKERPQESAKKTGCLKSATVVSAVGTPDEAGWIRIEKPVRGWIPAKITSEGFVWDERQGSTRTSGRSGAGHKEASSEPGVSGTYPSAPSSRPSGEGAPTGPSPGGGAGREWWRR